MSQTALAVTEIVTNSGRQHLRVMACCEPWAPAPAPSTLVLRLAAMHTHLKPIGPDADQQIHELFEGLARGDRAAAGRLLDTVEDEVNCRAIGRPTSAEPMDERPVEPSWRALLHDGHRARGLAAAREAGVLAHLEALPAADALLLADAARVESEPALATRLLKQVLERGQADAAEAALLMGRIEADARHPEAAATLFRKAIDLAPTGLFVEQARGRLMEVLLEAGNLSAARDAASELRRHHPRGAWAELANKVLARDDRR